VGLRPCCGGLDGARSTSGRSTLRYEPILARKSTRNLMPQGTDLVFQVVGVRGFTLKSALRSCLLVWAAQVVCVCPVLQVHHTHYGELKIAVSSPPNVVPSSGHGC
jgi:hypothetical protein